MPSTSYTKFEQRLALATYYRHLFGVGDPGDPTSVRRYHEELNEQKAGYDAEGRSYVYRALTGRVRDMEPGQLLRYDENIRRHTATLNRRRDDPITLKYFQILAALKTEHYLDHAVRDPHTFLEDINAFVDAQNEENTARITFPSFARDDLNKLAYWMATGSGKTLLLHLNYFQYLHYSQKFGEPLDHILLVTPNEGLSGQHLAEMELSSIPCRHFTEAGGGLFDNVPETVKVIEITKLVEEKTGGGVRVEVAAFEGRNLVFVDEGHKGSGSDAWRGLRAALAERGFTFEYSATFGQAVSSAATTAEVEEEYGRAILVNYAYPRFYSDGYGKDYRILNLKSDFDPALTERYLLANLLTFYEQARVFEEGEAAYTGAYNLMSPLMLFIGHTVASGKTRSQLGASDKRTLSDVQELTRFLHRVLSGDNWVPQAVEDILAGRAGLTRENGEDLFADAFPAFREAGMTGEEVYLDLLTRVFHVHAPAALHLVDLKTSEGEIGLRAGTADRFFGVINIGDDANFLRAIEKALPEVVLDESAQEASLFKAINMQDSPVKLLVGAKKFIEGWSSWRVSTMGLMNMGRGEGPQIIQLFGRGVRLKGRNGSLKRSSASAGEGPHPERLPLLETLNIFGVRAKYMAQFRDYLADEGIDTDERAVIHIDTKVQEDFLDRGLLTIRAGASDTFEENVFLRLEATEGLAPEIDLTPQLDIAASDTAIREEPAAPLAPGERRIPKAYLPLLDWNRLYREIWQYRTKRGYTNLLIAPEALREILSAGNYRLICPSDWLEITRYADLDRIESLTLTILRAYVTAFFSRAKREWEQKGLAYAPLGEEDDNIVTTIEARVRRSAAPFLRKLQSLLSDAALYELEDDHLPRVHFDRHLYLPLLKEDEAEVVVYAPPGLNRGEWTFVRDLREHLSSGDGGQFMDGKELYLLRNQARARGVGFAAGDETYFPDFILWLKTEDVQHIAFIDPKGLVAGTAPTNPKVALHRDIKTYERELNARSNRDDVRLHAFMISQTGYTDLKQHWGLDSMDAFNELGVYFRGQDGYLRRMFAEIA